MLKILGWCDDLPTTAGDAKLEWRDSAIRPSRAGDVIYLQRDDMSFFPLRDGFQFLYLQYFEHIPGRNARVWFGGTDESPFLVEMTSDIGEALAKCPHEDVFYESLVPEFMKILSRVTERTLQRQGDIFALPIGDKTRELEELLKGYSPSPGNMRHFLGFMHGRQELPALFARMEGAPASSYPIFGTRHIGHGRYTEQGVIALFQGRIDAPDHSPLLIEDQIHVLGQTNYLETPERAD